MYQKFILMMLALFMAAFSWANAQSQKPNVIIINADDIGMVT
ncbi:MAG: hypothetical protein R3D86_02565 [Emcibacteraceae bacterium]